MVALRNIQECSSKDNLFIMNQKHKIKMIWEGNFVDIETESFQTQGLFFV